MATKNEKPADAPPAGSPTSCNKEEHVQSPSKQSPTRTKKEEPLKAPAKGGSTSKDVGHPVKSPQKEILAEPKSEQPSKLPPAQPVCQGDASVEHLSISLSTAASQPAQTPPKQASVDTKQQGSIESPPKQASKKGGKVAAQTSSKGTMKERSSVTSAKTAPKGSQHKALGTKKIAKPAASAEKAKVSRTRSTQVDFDYDPNYWRYQDSWNPSYDWGYYGAYGEWRPEEEWPYYAPYGMTPVYPYHPFPPEPPGLMDPHFHEPRHEPPFRSPTCPIHGSWRHRPAPQSSQGTVVSIPIPIPVPMPVPSGSGGPVVINTPAPPPPPPATPAPVQQRSSALQDMVSLMTAMMLKDTFQGSINPDDLAAALRVLAPSSAPTGLPVQPPQLPATLPATLPPEPLVSVPDRGPSRVSIAAPDDVRTLFQERAPSQAPLYPAAEVGSEDYSGEVLYPVPSTNVGKKKGKKKAKTDKEAREGSDLSEQGAGEADAKDALSTAVPLVPVSKKGADEVRALVSSSESSEENEAHPDKENGKETPEEEEDEDGEEEEGEPATVYETASRKCLRLCCLLLLVLFLACIIVGNLAYIVAPKSVSDFLCSLGIYAPDNSSLADTDHAVNRSLLERPEEDEAFGRSIFDVHHPQSDDELLSGLDAEVIDEYDQEPDNNTVPGAGCNASSLCSRSTRNASADGASTESVFQRFINFDDRVVPPEFNDGNDEAFKTLGFDSFLDSAAVTRRSSTVPASKAGLQTPSNKRPDKSGTNPSALRDLLARYPPPSRGRFSKAPPKEAYVLDGSITQLDSAEVDRPVVTLEQFRVPTVPVTNTRLLFFQKAFRYSGKTDPPAVFDINRILPKGGLTFQALHTL